MISFHTACSHRRGRTTQFATSDVKGRIMLVLLALPTCSPPGPNLFFYQAQQALLFGAIPVIGALGYLVLVPLLRPSRFSVDAWRFLMRFYRGFGIIALLVGGFDLAFAAWLWWQGRSFIPWCAVVPQALIDDQYRRLDFALRVNEFALFGFILFMMITAIALQLIAEYARRRWPQQPFPHPPLVRPY